jgi:hypothetical protein
MAKRKSILKRTKSPNRGHAPLSQSTAGLSGNRAVPQKFSDLSGVVRQLDIILSTVAVARSALTQQAADIDLDVAAVLCRQVMEPLAQQIDRLRKLLHQSGT